MSEISVKSRFRDYKVRFVDDFIGVLKEDIKQDAFLIVDERVMALYGERLKPVCLDDRLIIVEAKEMTKTLDACQSIILGLSGMNIRKNAVLIALGGGIIQDITAFIASILFRGIEWHFYPTTLLAQADSCIGSKSSINIGTFKNQLGTFYPPSKIISDARFLATLPVSEIKSGIGEILHFLFIDGNEHAQYLSSDYEQILRDPALLENYVRLSLSIKKKIIEIDEFDKKERNIFNYGHTFGHAIEAESDFSIPHGQAVTMGMDMANYLSLHMGHMSRERFDFMHRILAKNMPVFKPPKDGMNDFFLALSKDKKNIGNNVVCILTHGPGEMFKAQVPSDDDLRQSLLSYFQTFV